MDRGAWQATYSPWGSQWVGHHWADWAPLFIRHLEPGSWFFCHEDVLSTCSAQRSDPSGPGSPLLTWAYSNLLSRVLVASFLMLLPCPRLSGTHRMLKLGMVTHIPLYDLHVFFFKVEECSKVLYLWSLLNFQWVSIMVTFSLCCRARDWECRSQTDWRRAFLAVGGGPGRNPKSYLITCIWFLPLWPIGVPVANERILKGVQGCN